MICIIHFSKGENYIQQGKVFTGQRHYGSGIAALYLQLLHPFMFKPRRDQFEFNVLFVGA